MQKRLPKDHHLFNFNFFLFIFILILVKPGIAGAQNSETDTLRAVLDEVRIEAAQSFISEDNSPVALSIKKRSLNDLAVRPAVTLDELTFSMPGVFVNNRENFALGERLTIRGMGWRSQFGVRGIQVILDDMPLTVADGQTILNMVDPAMVRRVELLRGPSSTFWGNSGGGVLHMSTTPLPGESSLKYRGFGGTYGTFKQEIQLIESFQNADVHLYGTYFETDGFRDHSAARMIRTGAGIRFRSNENRQVRLAVLYAGMPKAENPGSLTQQLAINSPRLARDANVNTNSGKNFDQAMVSGTLIQKLGGNFLDITLHGTYRSLENPLPFGFIDVERLAGGFRGVYRFTGLPFELQTGTELKWQFDNRLETNNVNGNPGDRVDVNQNEDVLNQALFARINIPVQRFNFSAALRADRIRFSTNDNIQENREGSRTFTSLNPGIGIVYKHPGFKLFTNLNSSFETPTTTELVNRPDGGNGFNQSVEPEKTWGIETGIDGSFYQNRFEYQITWFGMRVNDLLVPFQTSPDGPTFFRNEGKTRNTGVETSFKIIPGRHISATLMYSWLDAEFRNGDFEGNNIPGVSPHRGGIEFKGDLKNYFFSADLEWVGSYFTNSENSVKNDSYKLVTFRASHSVNLERHGVTLKPFLSVRNILNERFNTSVSINAFGDRFFEPGSDRSLNAGIEISFDTL